MGGRIALPLAEGAFEYPLLRHQESKRREDPDDGRGARSAPHPFALTQSKIRRNSLGMLA